MTFTMLIDIGHRNSINNDQMAASSEAAIRFVCY